jgi:hypothetical protein
MTVDRAALEAMDRETLLAEACRHGVKRAEVMTRVELTDEILRLGVPNPTERKQIRGWLGVARDLVASVVDKGLNLPDAAAVIRGDARFEPLRAPHAPVATVTLAEIYGAQGHFSRALGILDEVLDKEADHHVARRLRDRIESIARERRGGGAAPVVAPVPEVVPEPIAGAGSGDEPDDDLPDDDDVRTLPPRADYSFRDGVTDGTDAGQGDVAATEVATGVDTDSDDDGVAPTWPPDLPTNPPLAESHVEETDMDDVAATLRPPQMQSPQTTNDEPYVDNTGYAQPNTGYAEPAPYVDNTGYAQPNTGYVEPAPYVDNTGYAQPNTGYVEPAPYVDNTGYAQPNTGYAEPAPYVDNTGYAQPNTGYVEPAPYVDNTGYAQPNTGYVEPAPYADNTGYAQPNTGYVEPAPYVDNTGYAPPNTGYVEPATYVDNTGYAPPNTGYVEPAPYVDNTGYAPPNTGYVEPAPYADNTGYTQPNTGYVEPAPYVDNTTYAQPNTTYAAQSAWEPRGDEDGTMATLPPRHRTDGTDVAPSDAVDASGGDVATHPSATRGLDEDGTASTLPPLDADGTHVTLPPRAAAANSAFDTELDEPAPKTLAPLENTANAAAYTDSEPLVPVRRGLPSDEDWEPLPQTEAAPKLVVSADAVVVLRTSDATAALYFELGDVADRDATVVVRVVEFRPRGGEAERVERELPVVARSGLVTVAGLEKGSLLRAAIGVRKGDAFLARVVAAEVRTSVNGLEVVWSPRTGADYVAVARNAAMVLPAFRERRAP